MEQPDFVRLAEAAPARGRRRWSVDEKRVILRRAAESGLSISLVARQHGVSVSLLFKWRKQERNGALTRRVAPEPPMSELAQLRAEIQRLQQILEMTARQNQVLAQVVAGAVPGYFKTHPVPTAGVTWHDA